MGIHKNPRRTQNVRERLPMDAALQKENERINEIPPGLFLGVTLGVDIERRAG
jgi:hypothetical protein